MALILTGIMLLFRPPYDHDFGWHYRYGEWIIQHLNIPTTNLFSYTMVDYKWADSYWVSQVAIYVLTKITGVIGMSIILSLAFCLASSYIIFKVAPKNFVSKIILMLLWAVTGAYSISSRPFLFSSVFMLILIYILSFKKGLVKYTPLLFLLWVNFHADFMLGLFVLGIFSIYQITKKENLLKTVANTLMCFGATLLNPYGFGLWTSMLKELFNRQQFSWISEWAPIYLYPYEKNYDPSMFFAIVSVIIFFTVSFFANYKKVPWWRLLVGLLFLILTIRMRYFLRVFMLITIFDVINFWTDWALLKKLLPINPSPLIFKLIKNYLLVSLFTVLLCIFLRNIYLSLDTARWSNYHKMPHDAVAFIKTLPITGNIFNAFDWGGYLIWQLPGYKTFVDGRMTSWTDRDGYFLKTYDLIYNHPAENYETFLKYQKNFDIRLVLIPKESTFYYFLSETKKTEWKNVYQDKISAVFVSAEK